MAAPTATDRLSIRSRPDGVPLMYQSWRKLLFIHWRLPPELLRQHIPAPLEVDTFEGDAWVGITPFVVRNLRPVFLPALPWVGDFNEINVRTYVHLNGIPGVWFFSLDADSVMAVVGARAGYRLPYYTAEMSFREGEGIIRYTSKRTGNLTQPVEFRASWEKQETLGEAHSDSLEFFLVERYCLYAADEGKVYRARIFHPPWRLRTAQLHGFDSTMIEAQGLPNPNGVPLLHYSESQDAAVWPLKRVR